MLATNYENDLNITADFFLLNLISVILVFFVLFYLNPLLGLLRAPIFRGESEPCVYFGQLSQQGSNVWYTGLKAADPRK
eukprot:snap_masked-scaffold_2-processed-gene-7.41-mRNA-1 protein AED:1.00 eAED:1.00 QI:0/0/0/0/1/1/2/0/78